MSTNANPEPRHSTPPRDDLPTHGDVVLAWMERYLVHGPGDLSGKPFRVPAHLRLFVRELYRYDATGCTGFGGADHRCGPIVRRAILTTAKGNAKSEIAGAVALAELAGPTAPRSAEVLLAAVSYEQASLTFDSARVMVTEGPLAGYFDVTENTIRPKDGTGVLRRIAAEASTAEGSRATAVILDELHECSGPNRERLYSVLSAAVAKRARGLQVIITTAGGDLESLYGRIYLEARKVAAGEASAPRLLFHAYEADDAWDLDDREQRLAALRQANPADWLDLERIADRYSDPTLAREDWLRYHANRWAAPASHWVDPAEWRACARPDQVIPPGARVTLGFDGSNSRDCSVLVAATVEAPHRLAVVGFWAPTDGRPVSRTEVDATVADAFERFDVAVLWADPSGWRVELESWQERWADRVVAVEQHANRMAPILDNFRSAVRAPAEGLEAVVTHDGDRRLAEHVANARTRETMHGVVIRKEYRDSPRKIDGAIASALALEAARSYVPPPEPLVTFAAWV